LKWVAARSMICFCSCENDTKLLMWLAKSRNVAERWQEFKRDGNNCITEHEDNCLLYGRDTVQAACLECHVRLLVGRRK
jgi:hypothetical protein